LRRRNFLGVGWVRAGKLTPLLHTDVFSVAKHLAGVAKSQLAFALLFTAAGQRGPLLARFVPIAGFFF
jgi:hypothetical protein